MTLPDEATALRTRLCGTLRAADAGTAVRCCGWVARRREHGEHLAFVDLRDHSGVVQCVVPGTVDVRAEYVIAVEGRVRARPEGTVNPDLPTGEVELGDCEVTVLNPAEPPPFLVDDRAEVDEVTRLRYRFVDLRRPRMQANLRIRSQVNRAIRESMYRQGFVEVETPLLWSPTPEGAREFLVPSRLSPGSGYVLPQSPQLAKQLLMVGGLDRYFQIARCLRDEDLRADRQFEFTQLDLEASFVDQDDVIEAVSDAVLGATEAVSGERPETVDRITWAEAIDRFGTEKPDLRFGMELLDCTTVFAKTSFRAFRTPSVRAIVIEGGASLSRARIDAMVDRAKELGAKGLVWCRVIPGPDGDERHRCVLESPIDKYLSDEERAGFLEATRASVGDLILAVADEPRRVGWVLGQLRLELSGKPVGEGPHRFVWVVDFPLFEGLDEEGHPKAAHHPFTMPNPEDLDLLERDPLSVRSQAYDLVLNGWELGSGSVRIHRADVQQRVFSALGIDEETAEARFGFLLGAFRYGAPPHAGFAVGLDRLVAILAAEENIREVIAFPKTQSGWDPMTGAPTPLAPAALAAVGLRAVAPPAAGEGRGQS